MNSSSEDMIGQMLDPVFQTLPAEAARRIVEIEADAMLQQRVETLARKANEGELSELKRQEYAWLISAGDVLATIQALARRTLQRTAS